MQSEEPSGRILQPVWGVRTVARRVSLACTALVGLALSSGLPCMRADATDNAPGPVVARPADFSHPTTIDNPWFPMEPGMRWTYAGVSVEDDGKVVPHRMVVTATDLVKV